tara:strand:+ start:2503 stop:2796 length:294 start_codon:yes stop_codon:yes gene_type:complete
MGRFEIVSPERYAILQGRKLDFLYRMSPSEWRGSVSDGEAFILIEYKLVLIQIDIQKREMYLGYSKKPVLAHPSKSFNIYKCCDFFQWQYNRDNILD